MGRVREPQRYEEAPRPNLASLETLSRACPALLEAKIITTLTSHKLCSI